MVLQPIQMGARTYIPKLGRFLSVDPIEGGVENNYVYPPDAVNEFDLTETINWKKWAKDRQHNIRNAGKKIGQKRQEFIAWQYNHPRVTDALLMLLSARGGRGSGKGVGASAVAAQARQLGYTKMIPAHKAPFPSHGQPVFQKGNRYLTSDVDSHKGGYWKVFTKSGGKLQRETWNQELTVRVGR